jgi:hypothetical protein
VLIFGLVRTLPLEHVVWSYFAAPPQFIVDVNGSEVQVSFSTCNEPAEAFYRECFGTLDGKTITLETGSDQGTSFYPPPCYSSPYTCQCCFPSMTNFASTTKLLHLVFIECPDLSLDHENWTPSATAEQNNAVLCFVGKMANVVLVTGERFSRSCYVIGHMKRPIPAIPRGIGNSVSIRRPYLPLVMESTGGNRLHLDIIDRPTSRALLQPFHPNVDVYFDYGMLYGNVSEKSEDLKQIKEAILAKGKGIRHILHEGEVALSVLQGQLQVVLAIGDNSNHVTYLTEPGVMCGFIVEDIALVREKVHSLQIGEGGIACTLSSF